MKSNAAARLGLVSRDEGDRGGRGSVEKWIRRVGLEEQRLYEIVRLRTQFLQLLRETGLYVPAGSQSKGATSGHRRALSQAQHREHLQTKRRHMLTLMDNVSFQLYLSGNV